jgi:hypothetical protein
MSPEAARETATCTIGADRNVDSGTFVLLDRRRRLQTYTQLFATHAEPVTADDDSIEIDDPWADADSNASEKMDVDSTPSRTESKVPLSTFLSAPMVAKSCV